MKTILTGVTAFLAYLGAVASSIWAIVEFILYLVKDKVFNWWSVWMILICAGVALLMFIASAVFAVKNKSEIKNFTEVGKKSRFQERLEQMQKERGVK